MPGHTEQPRLILEDRRSWIQKLWDRMPWTTHAKLVRQYKRALNQHEHQHQ